MDITANTHSDVVLVDTIRVYHDTYGVMVYPDGIVIPIYQKLRVLFLRHHKDEIK